jgi:predicted dehydrogenase
MGTAAGVAAAAAMAGCAPEARRETVPAPHRTLGPNDRIGVGFIGCGGRAGAHMGCIRYLRDEQKAAVEPVAVCDVYRPRMERAKLKLGVEHGYMDHRDLLADPRVDVVCIATPDHHHCHQAIDAVRAGKDVYCEKPVSHWRQFALVKRLVEEVKKSGRVFQLGSQGMSDSAWRQMRKLIADGLIGQPIHADCGYFRVGDWGERGMPIDDPQAQPGPNLNWEAFLGDSPKRPFDVSRFFRWRMYEDYAGGPVTDLFPHSFTPVAYMLGVTFPSMVVATGGMFRYTEREVPDTFNMLIDYPQKITVAVLGTQGNNDPTIPGRGAGQRVPILRGWEGSLTVAGKEIIFAPAQASKKQAQRFPVEQGENLGDHWKNLLDAVRAGRPGDTWSPADLAYYVQTPLIMGMLALRQGKVATFDAAKEQILL